MLHSYIGMHIHAVMCGIFQTSLAFNFLLISLLVAYISFGDLGQFRVQLLLSQDFQNGCHNCNNYCLDAQTCHNNCGQGTPKEPNNGCPFTSNNFPPPRRFSENRAISLCCQANMCSTDYLYVNICHSCFRFQLIKMLVDNKFWSMIFGHETHLSPIRHGTSTRVERKWRCFVRECGHGKLEAMTCKCCQKLHQ